MVAKREPDPSSVELRIAANKHFLVAQKSHTKGRIVKVEGGIGKVERRFALWLQHQQRPDVTKKTSRVSC